MARLELDGVTVSYAGFTLSNLSLSCDGGEIVALVGRNGAGKTTTIDAIMGLAPLQSGVVRYDGQPVTGPNARRFKQKIGYVGASLDYYPGIRVDTLLRAVAGFYPQWDGAALGRYLSDFGIDPRKRLGQLSSGMKVKLSLAIALSHAAELYILDEPTAGLDPIVREQVLGMLERLARKEGACVLFSTHITQDVAKIASRVLFLVDGALALDADVKTLDERFVKLRLDNSPRFQAGVAQKGVVVDDRYMILKRTNVALEDIASYETAPLLIEDVLICLNGGIRDAPAD